MSKIILWLDDIRIPSNEWTWVKTCQQAIDFMKENEVYSMSLDHDLGGSCDNDCWKETDDAYALMVKACESVGGHKCNCECHKTGYDFVCWMEENDKWPTNKPRVHSANPVGASKMRQVIDKKYNNY